jgi:flagellar basal-body rod modification protein FlgD
MSPIVPSSNGAAAASSAGAGSTAAATTTASSGQVTENMFLQLLVAQLENQDPMSPEDGTQFVTQLAQFQQLEQSMNTGQDVAAIRAQVCGTAAAQSGANQTATA